MESTKIYFASDVHLGAPYLKDPKAHEMRFVKWLDKVSQDASAIYLLGDIFDFWWEYKQVVPRGFTRFLGKLSEITDKGIPVYFFIGNHDIWVFDYLETEVGVTVIREPKELKLGDRSFYMAHGDGLGDPSKTFKLLRKMFRSPILQKLFATFVHPDLALRFGTWWSGKSRFGSEDKLIPKYKGEDNEYLVQYAKQYLQSNDIDVFVFGHRHIVLDLMLSRKSRILILGDWLSHFSYGVFDGRDIWIDIWEEA